MSIQEQLAKRNQASPERQMHAYRKLIVVLICVFAFFFTTKLWMPDTSKPTNTAFGTSINTSDSVALVLDDWEYNPNSNYMEAAFHIVQSGYTYSSNLQFVTKLFSDNSQTKALESTVAYSDDDTLIVQMRNLPHGWKILSLRIGDNISALKKVETGDLLSSTAPNPFEAQEDETPAHFNADIRVVKMNTALAPKTTTEYAVQSITKTIADQNAEVQAYQKQITQNKQTISSLQKDIEEIEKEQAYQTSSELQGSNASIQNKQSQIDLLTKKNETYEEDIETCKGKIQKLNLKLSDLKTGTTRVYKEESAEENSETASSAAPSSSSSAPASSFPSSSSSPSVSSQSPVSSAPASQPAVSSAPAGSQPGITYTPIS